MEVINVAIATNILQCLIPISQFNKGQASKIFDRLHDEKELIVLKNNQPSAVILSPEEYTRLTEIEEDYYLLIEATKRIEDNGNKETVSMDYVMRNLGIDEKELENDFKINDGVVQKIKGDINFYFDKYAPNDNETKEFTKYISLYLALIVKKPLHPYGNDPKEDEVYMKNNSYYCKGRAKFIKDQKSLCRYCICKNPPFAFMF